MASAFSIFRGKYYRKYLKRIVDIVGALILIIVFSPVYVLAAIAIKVDSEGPILADVPERVGEHGRKFKMFKFRSMIVNAHHLLRTDPRFQKLYQEYKIGSYKLRKDPRITKVGKFTRRHSIDEIPQLVNVIHGEMSLVGPRAYYPDELENQQKKFPQTQKLVSKVLSVKPGITGLWQVSGRSEVNFDKRISIDASYVDSMSFWLDLKVILKTPIVMMSGQGAV
ncbi:sugar transferase [Candidatus Roizmanbacteria bacterium]|nr:sugar transferase [Candidatus Roizmanbacteria bacterium]